MIIRNHKINLKNVSPAEMARLRQSIIDIWRQQLEDDKNADEMQKLVRENYVTANTLTEENAEGSNTPKEISDISYTFNTDLTDPQYKYSGDFYSIDGRYLGNNGNTIDNNLYIVEKDAYRIHSTGKRTAEILMDKDKIINLTEKTGLTHSQMLDRANWIYAEGGYKIPEFYAYTIENAYQDKNIAKKKEARLYYYLMQDESGRLDKDKYFSGGYKNQTGKLFWEARGTTTMNNDMRNTIAAVIKSKLFPEKDPTGGTNSWLGYAGGYHQGEYYIVSLNSRHFFQKRAPNIPLQTTTTEKKYKTIE
ncbi:hypothetical protein [Flavobacterium poyangense]|uniref:hypothetical protein n=1 Tax=Flavobacterium poyangense TaxID=2204302 RepID=UPI001421EBFC|nr:hypothetical protein [Flavobacterium sp. JXAS1]